MICLTRAQIREVDRRSIEEYHIPGIVLMENAALATAPLALRLVKDHSTGNAVLLCGGGNNGGDGLAIARHLHNAQVQVQIMLATDPSKYQGDALVNWNIIRAMKLPCSSADPEVIKKLSNALLIDAIFGTGLTQAPRDPFASIVAAVRGSGCPVLAIDVPSGMDCDTGRPLGACIEAHSTITFVAWKTGFASHGASKYLGDTFLGDIGCPRELIEQVAASQ
jgi:NAD(P)H-hydrate epimerase